MALGWLRRLRASVARSTTANPAQWLIEWVRGGPETAAAIPVSPESAMRCAAVYACVRVLSEDVGKLPLIVYRRTKDGGKERASDHPLFALLGRAPNPRQTSFEFREMLQAHLELRGNAYAEIERDGRGRPIALWPQIPTRVEVRQADDGDLFYRIQDGKGGHRDVSGANMLHLRGLSSDGIMGLSTIGLQREAVGMALAAEKYGATFFANDAQPRGVLMHPASLDEQASKNIRDSWQKRQTGDDRHKVAVLEEGMKYVPMGMTNEDAQFLETRKFQRGEIASIFRIPPHKIGDLERATFSNIEQQAIEYVVDALLPRLRRWEQALERVLLAETEQQGMLIEFLVDGLLRGDLASRYAAYAVGRQWGWLSINDVREKENMNRIPGKGGDDYIVPLNQGPAGAPPPAATPPASDPATPPKGGKLMVVPDGPEVLAS